MWRDIFSVRLKRLHCTAFAPFLRLSTHLGNLIIQNFLSFMQISKLPWDKSSFAKIMRASSNRNRVMTFAPPYTSKHFCTAFNKNVFLIHTTDFAFTTVKLSFYTNAYIHHSYKRLRKTKLSLYQVNHMLELNFHQRWSFKTWRSLE